MTATARDRRDRLRAMLADLKMPGALEAVDGVLAKVDSGAVTAGEAIEQVLGAQIALRNNRRLQAAMRSSRLPAVKIEKTLFWMVGAGAFAAFLAGVTGEIARWLWATFLTVVSSGWASVAAWWNS